MEQTTLTECPNCKTQLKSGMFNNVSLLKPKPIELINAFSEEKKEGYCTKCGDKLLYQKTELLRNEIENVRTKLRNSVGYIPMVSIQSPIHWDYDVLGLVTGQSVTGTGITTEIVSSFTDLFGGQSSRMNQKLKVGETICKAQLRQSCLEMGGNAIVGVDVDYAEVGGEKGMLMVCMSGTAVRLKNIEILGEEIKTEVELLKGLHERNRQLSVFEELL